MAGNDNYQEADAIMTSNISSKESIQAMFKNMSVLRTYARRSILLEEVLEEHEEIDRQERLENFFSTGYDLNWAPKEVTDLLLREVFANPA